jgi:hypothetical protein
MRALLFVPVVSAFGSAAWSSPRAPEGVVVISEQTRSQSEPVRRTILMPVHDPRCGSPMPIFQDYREVSVEEADAPPKCRAR